MSLIKYAYLHRQTWIYRRNYPQDLAPVFGAAALKRSLQTSDAKVARLRTAEVNAHYEELVARARAGLEQIPTSGLSWEVKAVSVLERLQESLGQERLPRFKTKKDERQPTISELARTYLRKRGAELRPGGYKSVRYSVGLFSSRFGDRRVSTIGREDGREFLDLLPGLSTVLGKSHRSRRLTFAQALEFSRGRKKITARTQKRIWAQVCAFVDWTVYEGLRDQNPFKTVRFEAKVKGSPYAVLKDDEVVSFLSVQDELIHGPLLFCLLTGMRSGEASGLLRDDLVRKGNLGWFAVVRPNDLRELKTEASQREVPLHPALEGLLPRLPAEGPLFPDCNVNLITKRFSTLTKKLELERPGLVFHSTRKWFITQCERTGVPEHFTASLVGHKSARSENQLTYGIYSAGISDEQKRSIIDQIRLPEGSRV